MVNVKINKFLQELTLTNDLTEEVLTPDQARKLAQELLYNADWLEGKDDRDHYEPYFKLNLL